MNEVTAKSQPRAGAWAAVGLLVTLAGVPALMLTMSQPFLRATGLATFVLMGAGVVLAGIAARRDARLWVRAVAGVCASLFALWCLAFFVLFRVPADTGAGTLTTAPDFTLPDQQGAPVRLADALRAGPVLLVFYRGHW